MAENDLGDNNRILASISNGTGTSGMLAAVVSNIGGSIKSHPSAMTSDPHGASVNTQPQVQVLSHAPPPPTQQHQQQPQQTLSHHSHSSLSSQPSTASVGDGGGVGAGSSGGEGGASHISEGVIVNSDDVPKVQPGNFGISLATPTSQLLQHQQQQQHQQQHQLFLLQHQQQQQQQQQQQEHQRQFNELQEQEQRRLLQESIQPLAPVEARRELAQNDEILIPSQEQEYESLEAAQHAAERYARSVNTVVIVKRTTKDKHGNVVQKDLACERQGSYIGTAKKTPEAYNIRTKRCGCPWMISVGFSKKRGNRDGKRGRFTKLSLEHNHPLQPLPEDAPAGPSKLTLKDLRSGQTSVPKPEISVSASSRTQTSRARSSASKSAAAAAQALSSESSGPIKTNVAKGRGKDHDKENGESKGEVGASLDESRQLSNYNMTTFLPQAAILSSDRVSTVPSVSLPAGLQPSNNALGPLSSDVMSALGANAHDIHRPLQSIGRTDITWDDLKTQMSHIPWNLQSDAMKALMDVLQLTLQTYQVPTVGSNRHADAEASAAATAAAIADVVGSLPANYHPSTSHTQEQPHSHQPIQQPQAQAPPPPPPSSFARHHNLSSSRAGPSSMEGISHNLPGTTSTSELLQLHRADTGELNGGRERGHRRQDSSASGPIQGSGSDGSAAMMTSQPPSTQVSTAIPSVVSSLPPSANPTAPSTPSALSTTASPLLTAVPTLRNVIQGHMAPSVEPLQSSFLQHSRQSSHSGAGHHRTQSGTLANVNQGIHALDSNGSLLGQNHSQSNGTSNNSSMDSSPLISQTQTLLDAAARVHNNQSEAQRQAEEQAQIQAQVNADTEAAVNAALNMNALQEPTGSSSALSGSASSGHVGSTASVSNANATSSPIPLNLLDAVSLNTLPNFTQQLLQQQQRLQQLQQQQQHQQHQQQQQQQQQQQHQQPVHTHPSDIEKDGGSDLALSEPPRKRVKQEALYAPDQQ